MQTHSIILGRHGGDWLMLPGQENVLAYSPPRTLKTTGLAAPNAFHWPASLVVLDVRGQLFYATAGHRSQRLGQDVFVFDPAAAKDRTHRWNPLSSIDRRDRRHWDQISRLAYLLFPDAGATGVTGTGNADKFWIPAGRAAFAAVTCLIAETPDLPLDLGTVLRFFSRGDGLDKLVGMIEESRKPGAVRRYSQPAIDGIADMLGLNLGTSGDQIEGVRKVVSTQLAAWSSPTISAATRVSDFNLADLRRKPMTIYIKVNPSDMARMRPVLALFFETLVTSNVDKMPEEDETLRYQVLAIFDEFARMGSMPSVANAAQFIGGYGMRQLFIAQNKPQLEALYGRAGALDIIDNCGCELVSSMSDLATTQEVSARFGDMTMTAITKQRPRFGAMFQWHKQSEAEHAHRRPYMLPQEVARMRRNEQIVFRAGMAPVLTTRRGWFEDPELKKLWLPPPEIPVLPWNVPLDDGQTYIVRPKPKTPVNAGD